MGFHQAHAQWLERHIRSRKGERKGRLERGHGHGEKTFLEKVWWPLFGNLNDLHPEYEVLDWRGRPYFIDLAWMPGCGAIKFAIEVKGYGPHVQQMDRVGYRRELNRETYLQILGFRLAAIPYDDLEEAPELTINLLKMLLSPYLSARFQDGRSTLLERETLMLAKRSSKAIRPADLVEEMKVSRRTAVRVLQSLCDKKKMQPVLAGTGARIKRYELIHSLVDEWYR